MKKKLWALAVVIVELAWSVTTWPPRAEGRKPLLEGAEADGRVRAILERSCRDCHAAVADYPWYAYVAPTSLLVRKNVTRGREYLDLSRWPDFSSIRRQRMLSGMANQVSSGTMPPDDYLWVHPYAKLSEEEQGLLFDWTQRERLRLILAEHDPKTAAPAQE